MRDDSPDLFDIPAASAARDEAMARVDRAAAEAWRAFVSAAIVEVAKANQEFTTDQIERLRLDRHGPSTHEPRALGPLMIAAAKDGVCEKTGRVRNSAQICNHRRPMQIWRSLLYQAS